MKPFEDWPTILDADDIENFLGRSRSDAQAILKHGPVIDPDKTRNRTIGKGPLKRYLEG